MRRIKTKKSGKNTISGKTWKAIEGAALSGIED
jgi:hypothetical protein